MKQTLTTDRKVFLFLLLWSVAVLLLMSSDSPLHGAWDRLDSAIFFTSGKALMCGMKPYVDFADSKGLLLWLIYGIGYLLSPHTYHGVWVLSCLLYGGILYYNYKTAQLFLGDVRRSLAVAMVMPFFYFLYWFHDMVRAEDFCALFLSLSLYLMLQVLCSDGRMENARRTGLALGGYFMALVMIKFSIAAMQAAMLLAVAYRCFRYDRRQTLPLLSWMAVGAAAVALPFIIYMLLTGTFTAFIDEYFINTMKTVDTQKDLSATYLEEVSKALGKPKYLAMLLALMLSGWLVSRRLPRFRFAPLLVSLVFFAVCTRHTLFHYYNICCVFLLFLPVEFLSHADCRLRIRSLVMLAAIILGWGYFENTRKGSHQHKVWLWAEKTHEDTYNYFSSQIQGHSPTVLYLFGCDYGYGVTNGAVPAGKYWTYQLGTTPEMEKEHLRPLREGTADYIIVNDYKRCIRKGFDEQRICSYGYRQRCSKIYVNYKGLRHENRIYKRIGLD